MIFFAAVVGGHTLFWVFLWRFRWKHFRAFFGASYFGTCVMNERRERRADWWFFCGECLPVSCRIGLLAVLSFLSVSSWCARRKLTHVFLINRKIVHAFIMRLLCWLCSYEILVRRLCSFSGFSRSTTTKFFASVKCTRFCGQTARHYVDWDDSVFQ